MGKHAAWRHLKVDRPGGTFRGGPGRPVRLPGPAPACLRRRAARLIPALRHHWPLTGRELEVLRMLAAGRSNQASARDWWSPWTRSKACGPRSGQARRGQPHWVRGPGPRT